MNVGSDSLQSLVMARRLLLLTRQIEERRKNPHIEGKSFKEIIEEDEVQLSAESRVPQSTSPQPVSSSPNTLSSPDNVDIRLSDLIKQLGELKNQSTSGGKTVETLSVTQSYSSSLSIEWTVNTPVDGLVVRNQHLAETDTYAFEFIDGSTFKITDKSTGKSTTIWGDPHVDVSDMEGTSNGEFSDLKNSDSHTTFQLRDGTRVTFTARDTGLIEAVDIFKGNQHVHGVGADSPEFKPETGLFDTRVRDGSLSSNRLPVGDVVYAGGDGNDWYDSARRLIWGVSTGPMAGSVPASIMQIRYSEQFTQQTTIERINQTA